jgi:MinD superfamily P-loop ATPase
MKNEAIAEKTESSIEDVRHAMGLAEKVSIPHSVIDPRTNVQTIKLDEFWIINSDTGLSYGGMDARIERAVGAGKTRTKAVIDALTRHDWVTCPDGGWHKA